MEQLDELFMVLQSRTQGLDGILRAFFSWLNRRTDLYVVDPSPRRPMGFSEGQAEKLVRAQGCARICVY